MWHNPRDPVDEQSVRRTACNMLSLLSVNRASTPTERFPSWEDALEFPDVDCDEVFPGVFIGDA